VTAPPGDRREGAEPNLGERECLGCHASGRGLAAFWVGKRGPYCLTCYREQLPLDALVSRARAEAAAEMRERCAGAADAESVKFVNLERNADSDALESIWSVGADTAAYIATAIRALPDAVIEEKPR
jgi:hypothetical protein